MKSHFYNNTDGAKDMETYLELPLRQFIRQMPQYTHILANTPLDLNDERYIVRFKSMKSGEIRLEVGYPEDVEWTIGEPDKSKKPSYPSYGFMDGVEGSADNGEYPGRKDGK